MSARSVSSVVAALLVGGGMFAQESSGQFSARPNYEASRRSPIEIIPVWTTARSGDVGTAGSGTVTLAELKHQVPGKALKEWERAEKARGKGDLKKSATHLRKAIDIDPEFVAARNNLAAVLLIGDNTKEAIPQLEECMKLDPHSPMASSNLAVAYLIERNFEGAERAARRALDLDRTGSRARMVLGMTLVVQNKFTDEALQLLARAEADYPQATLLRARTHAGQGQRAKAIAAIQEYLQSGDTAGVEIAQEWLDILQRTKQTTTASVR